MSTPTKRSWPRMKAVESDEDRKRRLEKKLDSDRPIELEPDEITDIVELAQLRLKKGHKAGTEVIRDALADADATLKDDAKK